jgi:sRNA-binding protein
MRRRPPEYYEACRKARDVIPRLQEQWPLAFAKRYPEVRPLASSVTPAIAAAMGWSTVYTKGILSVWKDRMGYCDAVLRGGVRVDLNGIATDEIVDERAISQAQRRRADKLAAMQRRAARTANKEDAEPGRMLSAEAIERKQAPARAVA